MEWCWSDGMGRIKELRNRFRSAQPDRHHHQRFLVSGVVQFYTGGSWSCGCECD